MAQPTHAGLTADVFVVRGDTFLALERGPDEHTAFGWMTIEDYIARWCSEELEALVPAYAGWIRQVRTNCELLRRVLDGL